MLYDCLQVEARFYAYIVYASRIYYPLPYGSIVSYRRAHPKSPLVFTLTHKRDPAVTYFGRMIIEHLRRMARVLVVVRLRSFPPDANTAESWKQDSAVIVCARHGR